MINYQEDGDKPLVFFSSLSSDEAKSTMHHGLTRLNDQRHEVQDGVDVITSSEMAIEVLDLASCFHGLLWQKAHRIDIDIDIDLNIRY